MSRTIRSKLTFANVCSFLALFIALSTGTAYAADTVFSSDIVDGEVRKPDIHTGAVTADKVADDTLTAADIATAAVGSDEIATDAVGATEIADNTIDSGEIVNDSLFAADLATASVGASEIADSSITGTDVAGNSITLSDMLGVDANGAISLASGSVAAGRCRDFQIVVGGAVAGESVIINTSGGLVEGVLIYGVRVPANGSVTMKVCNFTGGTFPTISDLPIETLTFG